MANLSSSLTIDEDRAPNRRLGQARTVAKKLLFFSLEDWNEVWRRNQFICAALHDRHPELEILWVCPPVDVSYVVRRRTFSDLKDIQLQSRPVKGYDRILTIKPMKLLPNVISEKANFLALKMAVSHAVRQCGWREYTAWINDQRAYHYLPRGRIKTDFAVYDITDDWISMPQPERARLAVVRDDKYMLETADLVVVCSKELYQRKKDRCKKLSLIQNGVDNRRYHPSSLARLNLPPDLIRIGKPIVGYTGTLHAARLNVSLMVEVSHLLPEVNFVFVGPNCLTETETNALLARGNCHILGQRSYEQLPAYVAAFDACMTPHLVNDFTESLDPLKLYEYMSTGLPIISTSCAGFREFPHVIKMADTASQFAAAVRAALHSTRLEEQSQRLDWAEKQSWTARIEQLEELLGWNE